jgi:xylan 1,4-beta-xylosidase
MKTVYHEAMHPLGNLGLKISMAALESPHIPMHWHDAMEILFCLNGEVTIQIDHEAFLLSRNQLVVFDSKEMHSIQSASPLYMFLCIHVDKKQMALYCPDLELYHIQCQPLPLDHPKSTEYLSDPLGLRHVMRHQFIDIIQKLPGVIILQELPLSLDGRF